MIHSEIHSVLKKCFPKIIAIVSEQRQAGAAVGSFLLDILSNNSGEIVSRSTLYSGHLLWRFFLQRTHF